MNVIDEIIEGLVIITPEDIARVQSQFTPPEEGETVLAVVKSNYCHRLWTLAVQYDRQLSMNLHSAKFDTLDPAARNTLLVRAQRMADLERAVRAMAWVAIKDAMGLVFQSGTTIGIREGWKICSCPDSDDEPKIAAIPIPMNLLRQIVSRFRNGEEEDPPPPKKPQ